MPLADVLISVVGLRDGLQSVKAIMATASKLRWIDALYASGLREIEVCSFVPVTLLPQMKDAVDIALCALTLPGLTVMALVPNVRRAQAAFAAVVHEINIRVSASEVHSLSNVRKTRVRMVEDSSGNVVPEDLVFMFEAMGVRNGVDLNDLIAAREPLHVGLPGEPIYGMTAAVGLPMGWPQRAQYGN